MDMLVGDVLFDFNADLTGSVPICMWSSTYDAGK